MRRRPSRRSLKNTASFDLANATEPAVVEESQVIMQTDNVLISEQALGEEPRASRDSGNEPAILDATTDRAREHLGRSGPTEAPTAEMDVFDKLSKTLEEHASQLAEEEKQKEQALRGHVVDSLRHFRTDRISLGKSLYEYKSVFKSRRQWTRVAAGIGAVIEVSSRTVFRMIDDYESSLKDPQPSVTHDATKANEKQLSSRERYERRARLAIRAFLDDIPVKEKAAALADLLAEEAYQIWGKREKFSIVVTPRESRFAMDGRKRIAARTTNEVAA